MFLDHYRHRSRRGIGDWPHPHAGIEVISYLLEGGVDHRNSARFRDHLGPGDAQWIRAGRGMDTPEHMAQTKRDYASGKMGRLDGVPF